MTRTLTPRRLAGAVLLTLAALLLPSCEPGGHFSVFKYTTRPNYDPDVRTVRLKIFQNNTYWRDLEFEVAKALAREIEAKTPYKVVGPDDDADTELSGTIVAFNKLLLNRNQLNEIREAETTLAAAVVWVNLRTGEVLSQPRRGQGPPPPPLVGPGPDAPPPLPAPAPPGAPPAPVLVQSRANFIPELGQSITTARQANATNLAVQIVSMMESAW